MTQSSSHSESLTSLSISIRFLGEVLIKIFEFSVNDSSYKWHCQIWPLEIAVLWSFKDDLLLRLIRKILFWSKNSFTSFVTVNYLPVYTKLINVGSCFEIGIIETEFTVASGLSQFSWKLKTNLSLFSPILLKTTNRTTS